MYTLKNWDVIKVYGNKYYTKICGEVYGHPKFPDGTFVFTSKIEKTEGRKVYTHYKSVYLLDGPPSDSYLEYLADNDIPYIEDKPVNIVINKEIK